MRRTTVRVTEGGCNNVEGTSNGTATEDRPGVFLRLAVPVLILFTILSPIDVRRTVLHLFIGI